MKALIKNIYTGLPRKKELFSLAKRVFTPSEKLYRHLHFTGDFNVEVDETHTFKIRHYGYEVENTLFWTGLRGGWEGGAISVWCDLLGESNVIFDVGANTGLYSLVAKALNRDADVFAFEPIARVYEKLVVNNDLNRFDIECLRSAVSDEDGTSLIYDFPGEHTYSSTFHNEIFESEDLIATEVPVIKLETVIERRGIVNIDLMKIDVEGHEPAVLRGMGDYLEKFRPAILIEILTDAVGAEVSEIVEGIGYRKFYLDEIKSELREVQELTRRSSYNYLLCSEDVAQKIHFSKMAG